MKKIPGFYALFTAVLMALSAAYAADNAPTFDSNGCLADDVYFHVKCENSVCTISQEPVESANLTATDFACWSDLRSYIETNHGTSTIALGTNLNLGGYDGSKCRMAFTPFGDDHSAFDGDNHTIEGFCYVTPSNVVDAGFFITFSGRSFKNVTFEGAYVEGYTAGVAATYMTQSQISNVKIHNATMVGVNLGGLAYSLNNPGELTNVSIEKISMDTDLSNMPTSITIESSYIGGLAAAAVGKILGSSSVSELSIHNSAGIMNASYGGLIGSCSGYTNETEISGAVISSATISTSGASAGYAGGIVGQTGNKIRITQSAYEGSLTGNNVGGIIGSAFESEIIVVNNTYSNGAISTIGSYDHAGYIIGTISGYKPIDDNDTLYNNFHVGEDEVEIGVYGQDQNGNDIYDADSWGAGAATVFSNVRNAHGSLTANGNFGYHLNKHINNGTLYGTYMDFFAGAYDPTYYSLIRTANGVITNSEIESGLFAALMNYNLESRGQPAIWQSTGSGPVSFGASTEPNHLVVVQARGLSAASQSSLGTKPVTYEYRNVNGDPTESGEFIVATGFYTYTDAKGELSEAFKTQVNSLVSELGTGAMLVGENGYKESLPEVFDFYKIMTAVAPATYEVSYRYCATSCQDIDNVTSAVFAFLTPRIDRFTDNATTPLQLVPNVVTFYENGVSPLYNTLDGKLKFTVEVQDENGAPIIDVVDPATPSVSEIWSFQDIAAKIRVANADVVKKIVLTYRTLSWPESGTDFPTIAVSTPKDLDFEVGIYGYDKNSSMVQVALSSASVGDVMDLPYGAGIKVNSFGERRGYKFNNKYSITYQYSATAGNGCAQEPVENEATDRSSFGSVSELTEKMKACGTVEWTIGGLDWESSDDLVTLVNVKEASFTARKLYDNLVTEKLLAVPDYTLVEYNVTFDMNLPAGKDVSTVFLGKSWAASKKMTVEGPDFPKVYTTECPVMATWVPDTDESKYPTWMIDPQYYITRVNNNFLNYAPPTGADSSTTAYGYWPTTCSAADPVIPLEYVISLDGNNDVSDDPVVSVTLKQALDATTFISHPMVSVDVNQSGAYKHRTELPVADDTLSFVVNFLPKKGYSIKDVEFVSQSNTNTVTSTDLGLVLPENGDTTLAINNKDYQSMQLNVTVDYTKYKVNFVRPTTVGYEPMDNYLNPVEYYVPNGYLGRGWTDSKVYTVENGSDKEMPVLYALNGCIGWFPNTTLANAQPLVFDFSDPDNIASYPATLYPIYSETACTGAPYSSTTQTFEVMAHGEHLDALELWQIIGEDDELAGTKADTIRHSFKQDANDATQFTIDIPRVLDNQVAGAGPVTENYIPFTFELHAAPSLGYGAPSFEDVNTGSPINAKSLKTSTTGNDLEISAVVPAMHYNLAFNYPSDEDLFVANKLNADYSMDWYGTENMVTVENIRSPMLYNSSGCRIGWKVKGTSLSSRKDESSNIRVVMGDFKADEDVTDFVNVMVPDVDNPSCTTNYAYEQILDIEGKGEFYLMQNIGDTALTHRFVDNAGTMILNVPAANNDKFDDNGKLVLDQSGNAYSEETGIRLIAKAVPDAGYVLSKIVYTNSSETKTVKNGLEMNIMEAGEWKVVFAKAGPYYITYDLNTTDNYGNDLSETIYLPRGAQKTVEFTDNALVSGNDVSLLKPVSSYRCFDGWTDEYGANKYTDASAMMASEDVRYFSTDENNPTVLYAAWTNCSTPKSVELVIDNAYKQTEKLTLYQKFGSQILQHSITANYPIELESASYTDYMNSVSYTGYDFYVDEQNSQTYSGNALSGYMLSYTTDVNPGNPVTVSQDGDVWHITNDGVNGVPTFMFAAKNAFRLGFSENVNNSNSLVFIGSQNGLSRDWRVDSIGIDNNDRWTPYVNYYEFDDNTFPTIYYRVGYCLDGYTFEPDDATNGVYKELSANFVAKYNELHKTPGTVLFAHWTACDNKYYTVTSPDLKYGTMTLKRREDIWGVYAERDYPVTSEGLKVPYVKNANNDGSDIFFDEFRFDGVGNYAAYYYGKLDYLNYRVKGSDTWVSAEKESEEKINKYGLSIYDYFEVNADMEVSVRFRKGFFANASSDEVFFGTDWVWYGIYGIEEAIEKKVLSAAPDIGRADACVIGWGQQVKDEDKFVITETLDKLIENSKFYVIWNDSPLHESTGSNQIDPSRLQCKPATYTITSSLGKDEPMLILTQTVGDSVFAHWVGESGLKVPATLKHLMFSADVEHYDNYAAEAIHVMDAQGNVLKTVAPGESFEIVGNTVLKVDLESRSIHVALDENSKDSVFFGSDWTDELTSVNQDSSMKLPTIVYNSEKCLAGWTTDPKSDELLTVIDSVLLSKLRAKGKNQGVDVRELLYAKWTTNLDSCAGEFLKLAVEQENGSVWFAEGNKDKTVERRFTDEGTMFVPMELNGRNLRVQAMGADTAVYVLDSLVVLRDGKVDEVLHVGDYMPDILDNVTLKAYFGWKNKTKLDFAKARLDSTGSMFQLSFTASDFEVRRKVSAKVQVIDVVKDSIVTQSVFGDSVAMGFDTTFVFRMKKPGNYRMIVTLEDKTGVKEKFSREFSIDPVISSIAVDSWQMLSLSAVDMPSITWDGDQIFYWWDERGTGEFWQYKQLAENDSMDATRGVWYNSLEGRPLPLRDEIDDEGEDFVWKLDNVSSGWNLVANPHGWKVELFANYPNAVKDIDKNPDVAFWSWNTTTGQYDPMPTEIGPYEAVWVHVAKKTKWKMSAVPVFKPETKAVEKSRVLAKATTKDRWTLQAVLSDEKGKRDSWNILGAGLNPLATEEPPESMADHVNLSIMEGKRALAKSIKEASNEMEWTIALSASSDRIGYLSFEGVDGIRDYGYRVFVTIDGNTTEMQNGVPIKVYLKSTAKTATVRVAPAARVVAQNTLKGLRMARLGNQLRVSFEASEGLAGTNASVDILDMKGHVMATASAKALEGSNALVLDAPQTGLYMLRVRAGSQQQATKVVVK